MRAKMVSHPTRVRGLKFALLTIKQQRHWSHPTRVRGLKFYLLNLSTDGIVAPYTGAWIEIVYSLTVAFGF